MPLERPLPSAAGPTIPTFVYQGGRWTTRFVNEKPLPLGAPSGFVYARERSNGYLTNAPCYPADRVEREKAVEYLDEYGEHDYDAYVLQHPWDMLLRFGGAKEFPVAQILEHMWQWNPPVIDGEVIEFPQLEGVDYADIVCAFCGKRMPSENALHDHSTVMHPDRVAAGDLAAGVTKGMRDAMAVGPSVPEQDIFRCTHAGCSRFFDSEEARKAHDRGHREQVTA